MCVSLTLRVGRQCRSAGSCSQPATCVLDSTQMRNIWIRSGDRTCHSCVGYFSSKTLYTVYQSEAIWGSRQDGKNRTCDSGQVLYSRGLSSSCLSHQENSLPFGHTHGQLLQQHSRGTCGSKCLVFPVHGDEKHIQWLHILLHALYVDTAVTVSPPTMKYLLLEHAG